MLTNRMCFEIFPISQRYCKLEFLSFSLDYTSQLFQIPKENENKAYRILIMKHQMNKIEKSWKFLSGL